MTARALPITAAVLAVSLLVDLLAGARVGFYQAVGLLGCVAIILLSKRLGDLALSRPEDLYPEDLPPDLEEDLRG